MPPWDISWDQCGDIALQPHLPIWKDNDEVPVEIVKLNSNN